MDTKEKKNEETFCVMPWVQVAIRPDGSVRPCSWCTDTYRKPNGKKYRIYESDITDILSSKSAVEFKKNILTGIWNKACIRCKEAEEVNVPSRRQNALANPDNQREIEAIKSGASDIHPTFIDLRPSNMCNLGCITCDHISSSWIANQITKYPELKKFHRWQAPCGETSTKTNSIYFDNVSKLVSNANILYLTGGEPSLIKENWTLLRQLIESGKTDIEIRLSINLSQITNEQINILNQFSKLGLYFSIDAIEDQIEYIRYPVKWTLVEKNLKRVLDRLRVNATDTLLITPTVSIFNVFSFRQLLEWKTSLPYKNLSIHFYALLHDPKEFSIKNMPTGLKSEAKKFLRETISAFPEYEKTLSRPLKYLDQTGDVKNFYAAKEVIDLIDSTRKVSCKTTFPYLYQHLSEGYKREQYAEN